MAEVARLQVVIGARVNEFNKAMGYLQKNVKRTFGSDNMGISKGALGVLAGVSAAMGALGLASVRAAGQMEQTRIAFTTLLKDGEKAKAFLSELERFSASTPFELPGVLDASKRLLAFGFSAQQVIPILTAVGDSAAALGIGEAGIQRLTLAIGQMQAKGKVSAEEMLQLAEAGVPAWDMLAQKIGVDIPTAMDRASKGQISAAEGIQAIVSGMNSKFGGMMAQQSQTINGIMSNIQDSVTQSMVAVGDAIIDAFDLKSKLKGAQDALGTFTENIKTLGIAGAIREIPTEWGAAMAVVAGATLGIAIPAIVALGGSLVALAAGAGVISAPFIAAGAAIGAVAYAIFENWDWLVVQWEYFCNTMANAIDGATAEIQNAFASAVAFAAGGLDKLFSIVGVSSDLAAQAKEWADNTQKAAQATIEATKANQTLADSTRDKQLFRIESINAPTGGSTGFKSADVNNLGLNNGTSAPMGGVGKAAGVGGMDQISREIDRINEQLVQTKEKTLDMQADFNNFSLEIAITGLSDFEQVYANITKEGIMRMNAVDEWKTKFTNATKEAQQLYERAMKTGDDTVIANALAMLEQRKAAEIAAAQGAADAKLLIEREYNDRIKSEATAVEAYKAELDEMQKQGDLERYIAYLDEERAAFLERQSEKQEIMQTYNDWRMEAEQTYATFALDAINTLKDGLASSLANAITNGDNLGKSMQNLGKQIVNMFLQWKLNQLMAQALLKAGILENMGAQIAAGKAIAEGTREAALYANMLSGGTLAPLAAASIQTSLGSLKALSGGLAGDGKTMVYGDQKAGADIDMGYKRIGLAAGGVITAPTHALIGEKSYPEAVIPLRSSVLEKITSFLFDDDVVSSSSGNGVQVEVNNYGDINTGADYDTFMGDVEYSLAMGMRG